MNTGTSNRAVNTESISRHVKHFAGIVAGVATLLAGRSVPAQIIQSFPEVDTVYFVSGCTPPAIVFSLESSGDLTDSLIIAPGFNTSTSFGDSFEVSGAPTFIFLLINDSSRALTYRLDLRGTSPDDSYSITPGSTCEVKPDVYRMLLSVFRDGAETDSVDWTAVVRQVPLKVCPNRTWYVPGVTAISAYPNPFNPITTVRYSVSRRGKVSLKIYDAVGREVRTLVEAIGDAGEYEVTFDGSRLSSGVYFVRHVYDGRIVTCKLVLMK